MAGTYDIEKKVPPSYSRLRLALAMEDKYILSLKVATGIAKQSRNSKEV